MGTEAIRAGQPVPATPRYDTSPAGDHREPMSIMAFTVVVDRIAEIDGIADPERLAALDLYPD